MSSRPGDARRLGNDVVFLIDALEEAGLVRRERNPQDRRAYVILLTPKGDDVQRRSERALNAKGREFFGVLSTGSSAP